MLVVMRVMIGWQQWEQVGCSGGCRAKAGTDLECLRVPKQRHNVQMNNNAQKAKLELPSPSKAVGRSWHLCWATDPAGLSFGMIKVYGHRQELMGCKGGRFSPWQTASPGRFTALFLVAAHSHRAQI